MGVSDQVRNWYSKTATSIVLAFLDALCCTVAFVLAFVFHDGWSFIFFTSVLPLLLLITVGCIFLDLSRRQTRSQALTALILALLPLAVWVWFLKNLDL